MIAVVRAPGAGSGSLEVRGAGFTQGSSVTVVILDGRSINAAARKASATTVAVDGTISVLFPLDSLDAHGPNGSQDPAWMNATGLYGPDVADGGTQRVYGPNGSQDPAWTNSTGMTVPDSASATTGSVGCDPRDLIRAYDPALGFWTPAIPVVC